MTSLKKGKALGACNTKGLKTDTRESNYAAQKPNSKVISTQIAELALRGHAVHQLIDGGFLVCKYGYTHHAPDFESLQIFAQRLGVNQ